MAGRISLLAALRFGHRPPLYSSAFLALTSGLFDRVPRMRRSGSAGSPGEITT
jgi:hypothetical protein